MRVRIFTLYWLIFHGTFLGAVSHAQESRPQFFQSQAYSAQVSRTQLADSRPFQARASRAQNSQAHPSYAEQRSVQIPNAATPGVQVRQSRVLSVRIPHAAIPNVETLSVQVPHANPLDSATPAVHIASAQLQREQSLYAQDRPPILKGAKFHERFYDSSVTDQELIEELRAHPDPKAFLSNLVRERPSSRFSKIGRIGSFDFVPQAFGTRFALNYYVPKAAYSARSAIRDNRNARGGLPVMVLLHGGGASTASYESAKRVSVMYLSDFLDFSEKTGTIILAPSSSIGWNLHTSVLLSEMLAMARAELPMDPDRVVLFGHSMGAMGITRALPFLVGEFSAFFATAAGTQPEYARPHHLLTYFNTSYYHLNGENDDFTNFKPAMLAVERKVRGLEAKLRRRSGFDLEFHPGNHDYPLSQVNRVLTGLIKLKRDLHRKRIFPFFYGVDYLGTGDSSPSVQVRRTGYLWVEGLGEPETIGSAKEAVLDVSYSGPNQIDVQVNRDEIGFKGLRIYLSQERIDFARPIEIRVNGRVTFNDYARPSLERLIRAARERKDHRFLFEDWVDISLASPTFSGQDLSSSHDARSDR